MKNTPFSAAAGIVLRFTMGHCRALPVALARLSCYIRLYWYLNNSVFKVEFLCERGADVNRGLRSSSLHYAACFGRPQIVKVMTVYYLAVYTAGCSFQY